MTIKRLKTPSGEVANTQSQETDSEDRVIRPAILVHSGPEGHGIVFQSSDGETKPFDEARIKKIVEIHNAKIEKLAAEYGGLEKMPVGAFPPVLDQHADDSSQRIRGRLPALLRYEKRDVPGVGKNVACAVTDISFLGKDSVSRVNDGRIFHLSIGIDEATDSIEEVSTVIEPAAPGAMLLNKGKQKPKETQMSKVNLEAKKEKIKALKAATEALTTLQAGFKKTGDEVQAVKRLAAVKGKLSQLMESKKLTPAQFKAMDLKKLSRMDEDSFGEMVKGFQSGPDVISPAQKGTTTALPASDVTKNLEESQKKRLKAETRADLKRMGAKMPEGADVKSHMAGPKEEPTKPDAEGGGAPAAEPKGLSADKFKEMGAYLEKDDLAGAKAHYAEMAKGLAAADPEGEKADMASDPMGMEAVPTLDGLQKQVDELSTQLARCVGLVAEMAKSEEDELGGEGHDPANPAEANKDEQ